MLILLYVVLVCTSSWQKAETARQVVVLVGPHKTGSTSIQSAIREWVASGALENWSWPVPDRASLVTAVKNPNGQNEVIPFSGTKGFAPLAIMLRKSRSQAYPQVLRAYQVAFQKAWESERNLLIASEEFDRFTNNPSIVESFLGILPKCNSLSNDRDSGNYNCELKAVVVYRTPRLDHLMPLFHQVGRNMSFSDFILNEKFTMYEDILNPLGLAQTLVQSNVTTFIINSGAVVRSGKEVPEVVACRVLETPCVADIPLFLQDHLNWENIKTTHNQTLSQEKLVKLGEILEEFDCTYVSLLQNPKVRFIYEEDAFLKCFNRTIARTSFQDVTSKLQAEVSKSWTA